VATNEVPAPEGRSGNPLARMQAELAALRDELTQVRQMVEDLKQGRDA
jgi:hypothetical protein